MFEFILAEPTCVKAVEPTEAGEGEGVGVGVGGMGAVDLQTEGCPEQTYPLCIWQLIQPGVGKFPASHFSLPTISPSPQIGLQTPC